MNTKMKRLIIITPIVFILIMGLVLYFVTRKPEAKDNNETDTNSVISSNINIEDIDAGGETVKESEESKITLTLDENIKTDNRTGEKAEEPAKPKEPMVPEDAKKPLTEKKEYVQDADPNTGLSWDGKSAIVYRLANGEESFNKQYGAYYEIRPDIWVLLEEPTEKEEWDGKCHHCGKTSGDGQNGSCVRWMMDDEICPHCKEKVPVNTCHTCKK